MKNKNIKDAFAIAVIGTIISGVLVSASLAQVTDLKVKKGVQVKKPILLKQKDSITKYKNAKEQYKQEINVFKNTKKEFLDAKTKFKNFKNKENKEILEKRAKNYIKNIVLVLIKKTESIKAWVFNNKSLSEQEKNNIINELDSDISWLNSKTDNIDNATQLQVKDKAKEIKNYWQEHRIKIKKITGQVMAARINALVKKTELVSANLSKRLIKLKESGKDVSALEEIPNILNEKINLAKIKAESAKGTFSSILNLSEEANNLFLKGRGFIKQSYEYIKEGRNTIKQMISAYKQANK